MPSRLLVPRIKANVRYNDELELFEMYCPDCPRQANPGQQFWPLTLEFWSPHSLQRCRACDMKKRRDHIARRRREDPAFRERQVAHSREIRGYQPRTR